MFYGLKDPADQERLRVAIAELRALYPHSFSGDMLISLDRNLAFLGDGRFMDAMGAEAHDEQERTLLWRLHVLVWCAQLALRREGDFVECGVFKGFSTAVAARYLDFASLPRRWVLYDTFAGIPEDQLNTGHHSPLAYALTGLYQACRERFAAYPNIEVVQGRVPEVLSGSAPERVAFLHLDMNSADAESAALEFFWPRLAPGACVLLDDYGWRAYREQMLAANEFFGDRGIPVLELPTGQGLAIL